ncbi:unnamed protein product [Somion occarium]|uniref:Uncharacterized protein n=1 Tax=Somion occarium TaxID=3059160 RepID=A0ABP1D929_9APHY
MLSQITAANDSESQSQPADSYRPTTDVAVGSMGDTPNISLMTDGARYMMYGYCVSHTWLLMYARHHNLVTNNQRPDDLKAIFDIRKRINWHDIRSTTVPTKCVYRILHKDTGGTLKSMKGLDIECNCARHRLGPRADPLGPGSLVHNFIPTMVSEDGQRAPSSTI